MSIDMMKQKESMFKAGFSQTNPFEQKKQLIKVLETKLAGIYYSYDDAEVEEFKGQYPVGTELKLVRDTTSEFDRWAVQVLDSNNELLGYICRYKNETVARLLDCGKKMMVQVIDESEKENDNHDAPTENGLLVAVYMEE